MLYLAGAGFEKTEIDGRSTYKPISFPDLNNSSFSVPEAVKAMAATSADSSQPVIICDIPDFGDSTGSEVDISNGIGTIRALRRAASVKPILVLDGENVKHQGYQRLQDTVEMVSKLMGTVSNFGAFGYIFTRCAGKETNQIHQELADCLRDHPSDQILDSLFKDMVAKTDKNAIIIDPKEEGKASFILKDLSSSTGRIDDPANCFIDSVPERATLKLNLQVIRMLLRIDNFLSQSNVSMASRTLHQLSHLAELLLLPEIQNSFHQGQTRIAEHSSYVLDRLSNAVTSIDVATAENAVGDLRCLVDIVYTHKTMNAFEQGLQTFANLATMIQSYADYLVESLIATKSSNEYQRLLWSLKQKLMDNSKVHQICKYYNMTLQDHLDGIIDSILENLVHANADTKSMSVFQSALHRHLLLVQILHEVVGAARIAKATDVLIGSALGLTKHYLGVVEYAMTDRQPITTEFKHRIELSIQVLWDMNKSIEEVVYPASLAIRKEQWHWVSSSLREVRSAITQKFIVGKKRIRRTTKNMNDLLSSVDASSGCSSFEEEFQFPSLSKELLNDRVLLQWISSSNVLYIVSPNLTTSSSSDVSSMISRFDDTIVKFLLKMVTLLKERVETLVHDHVAKTTSTKKVSTSSNEEAQRLFDIAQFTSDVCDTFVDINPIVLRDNGRAVTSTIKIMEGLFGNAIINKKKNRRCGGSTSCSSVTNGPYHNNPTKTGSSSDCCELGRTNQSDMEESSSRPKKMAKRDHHDVSWMCVLPVFFCYNLEFLYSFFIDHPGSVANSFLCLTTCLLILFQNIHDNDNRFNEFDKNHDDDDTEWDTNFEQLKCYKERYGCFPSQQQQQQSQQSQPPNDSNHDDTKLQHWFQKHRLLLQLWFQTGEYYELDQWIQTGKYPRRSSRCDDDEEEYSCTDPTHFLSQHVIAEERYQKMMSIGAISI